MGVGSPPASNATIKALDGSEFFRIEGNVNTFLRHVNAPSTEGVPVEVS